MSSWDKLPLGKEPATVELELADDDLPLTANLLAGYLGSLVAAHDLVAVKEPALFGEEGVRSHDFSELTSSRPSVLSLYAALRLEQDTPLRNQLRHGLGFSTGYAVVDRYIGEIAEEPTPSPDQKENVIVLRIHYESPLRIVLCGSIASLVLAVIVSGGSIEVSADGVKAELPPIGEGILLLREALGPGPVDIQVNQEGVRAPTPSTQLAVTRPSLPGSQKNPNDLHKSQD